MDRAMDYPDRFEPKEHVMTVEAGSAQAMPAEVVPAASVAVSTTTDEAATVDTTAVAAAVVAPADPVRQVKVRIDAGGREIEIECSDPSATAEGVSLTALALWRATSGAVTPSDGPASFGLTADRGTDRGPSSTIAVPVDVPQ
jgi:hypothetical protein